jgi:preprotein translocase subunit SecB
MTRDGGLPPLLLQPLDFVQLYRARVEEMNAQQAAGQA